MTEKSEKDQKNGSNGLMKPSIWPAQAVKMVKLSDLKPYSSNSRTHSEAQIDQIARSISEWGWTNPVLIAPDMTIIAGHGRVMAASRLGIDEVPVMTAENWTEKQIKAYVIADNKLAINAGWDEKLLASEISELGDLAFDISLLGFSDAELMALTPTLHKFLTPPDHCPMPTKNPITRPGDFWKLGRHVLACADALQTDAMLELIGDKLANMCWTDPPDKVDEETDGPTALPDENFAGFLLDGFVTILSMLEPGASIYVCHNDLNGLNFRASFKSSGFFLSRVIIWDRGVMGRAKSDYGFSHDAVLYGWKPGAKHKWLADKKQKSVMEISDKAFSDNGDGSYTVHIDGQAFVITGKDIKAEPVEASVIRYARKKSDAPHPAIKPVEMVKRHIENSCPKGGTVFDPFCGSGTTIIACEMTGRAARCAEINPIYADMAVKRWQEFTGQAAINVKTGEKFSDLAGDE